MLALIYTARCLHPTHGDHPERLTRLVHFNSARLTFGGSCRDAFVPTKWGVEKPVDFVDDAAVDHFGNVPTTDAELWDAAELHDAEAEHRSSGPRACWLDHSAVLDASGVDPAKVGQWVLQAAANEARL